MELAKESLEIKRKILEKFTEKNLYPYTKYYLRDVFKRFGAYWSNHFSTIGVVGMHEACINLHNQGIESDKGRSFAIKIMNFMREKLELYQHETENYYNLEATPAESAAFRLAKLDRKKGLASSASNDAELYTNSTQLPVNYSNSVLKVIKHQDELQSLYTGGTVLHVFTGEANTNPESVKQFVKNICNSCKMPYFTITPTFSICPVHGYLKGRHDSCPVCKSECEVYSRVVGYLRPVNQWNDGKAAEFEKRTTFSIEG
jgi:ribonucleoside-triphosphate reductase